MNVLRKSLFAAIGCVMVAAMPAAAAPDGTLGMALLSAAVNVDGTLARGSGAVSAAQLGAAGSGRYQVIFDRDVTACVYSATIGAATVSNTATGFIEVTRRLNAPNGVFVETKTTADADGDRPFYLLVFCAR